MSDQPRTAEQVLAEYKLLEPFPVAAELLGILRRVLEVHCDDGSGWCKGCTDMQGLPWRLLRACPVRAAFLAAAAHPQFDRPTPATAQADASMANPDGEPRLVVVEWEDSTNIQEWTPLDELASWAGEGGWRVRNVGYLVHEDDECVVLAGRLAADAQPPQAGLYERIPKRAIIDRRPAQVAEHRIRPTGYVPPDRRGDSDGRQAEQGHVEGPAA